MAAITELRRPSHRRMSRAYAGGRVTILEPDADRGRPSSAPGAGRTLAESVEVRPVTAESADNLLTNVQRPDPELREPASDAMKERGLRSSWRSRRMLGVFTSHDEGGP